jgi:hypothetical protein
MSRTTVLVIGVLTLCGCAQTQNSHRAVSAGCANCEPAKKPSLFQRLGLGRSPVMKPEVAAPLSLELSPPMGVIDAEAQPVASPKQSVGPVGAEKTRIQARGIKETPVIGKDRKPSPRARFASRHDRCRGAALGYYALG